MLGAKAPPATVPPTKMRCPTTSDESFISSNGLRILLLGSVKPYAYATSPTNLVRFDWLPAGTLPVYIGDDTTDEDVFRYLRPLGIGIKVGADTAATEASGRLPDPFEVGERCAGRRGDGNGDE